MVQIDFYIDVASPNAYLVHKIIPDIEKRTGETFNYIPCLLGGIFKATGNQAPIYAFANVKGKLDYERLETARFIKRHGLNQFKWNSAFPVNTLTIMRASIAAMQDGRIREYFDAGTSAMWEQDINLGEEAEFISFMDKSGFDGSSLLQRAQDAEVKAKLLELTNKAVERGAFGLPTIFVGNEIFVGKERLGQVEEEIIHQKSQS